MRKLLRGLALPVRAPMLLLLLAVSVYEGLQWSLPSAGLGAGWRVLPGLLWSVDCLHTVAVVVVCTMPDLLLQRVSNLMAASRVMSLVITLLVVTVGGLYLLHLKVLSSVLILGSSVLLARLDMARIRVNPPPLQQAVSMVLLVLFGAGLGRWLIT
ncbi:MAG: hypothetical protein VKK98_01495 [Cyanobacteriota bacterium]|nr:hypothetical protein [Cyanobacteriota bacterium]